MKKLTEIADRMFFASVAANIGGDIGTYINDKVNDYEYYIKLNYKDVQCYENVDEHELINARYFCNLYSETIEKTFAALAIEYDALSLINTTKQIEFDATDSNDRTLAATTDSETTSATTFDSSTPKTTGKIEYSYSRTDNADITMNHDTTETYTGNDGKRMPQELIQAEIDFRMHNAFMIFLCGLVKACFDCGVYDSDDL